MTEVPALTRSERTAVSMWLLDAARDEATARDEWATRGVTVLACGGIMSAVRIPAELVEAAAGSAEPGPVCDFLRQGLRGGPVIADIYTQLYYALVPAATATSWPRRDYPGTRCLGSESCLGVPAVDRTEGSPGRSYWCVPPCAAGALCDPRAVDRLVRDGLRAYVGTAQ
ncbi:hypothetical protein [Streptomyces sp. NPDC048845]|uniref:hypothetical protein n=1 Tax=Streptomyces sp. NPDC048845 TaxID=3155390 RepID=UPI00343026C0